jgi:large-conductance mechanosensitive channel
MRIVQTVANSLSMTQVSGKKPLIKAVFRTVIQYACNETSTIYTMSHKMSAKLQQVINWDNFIENIISIWVQSSTVMEQLLKIEEMQIKLVSKKQCPLVILSVHNN